MIKKLVAGFSVWTLTSSGLLIGKTGSSNDLIFGNYSDYISPEIIEELKGEFGLRVDLFDYDHLVKERFEKGIYDMAIVSTSVLQELKNSEKAMKLDWNLLLNGTDSNTNNQSKTSSDAQGLFTEIVQNMSGNLLDYGIPYFVQKLGFYYVGDPITSLQNNQPIKFRNLIEKISQEDRFKSKDGKATLGLIDDPRTVLSLSRKVSNKDDVNPREEEYSNSNSIFNDYRSLINVGLNSDKLGKNFLFMTPDSGPLVDALSDGTIKGAFMYNGDGYFAANGGNAEKDMEKGKFHTVELSENIFFLDFLTFSSKMSEDKKKKAHNLAKKLLFMSGSEPFKKKNDSEEEIEYEEMATRNFDFVGYTPTLKSLYEKLDTEYFDKDKDKGVGNDLKKKILKVEKPNVGKLEHDYEKQLSPKNKSDMLIAYSNFKSLL